MGLHSQSSCQVPDSRLQHRFNHFINSRVRCDHSADFRLGRLLSDFLDLDPKASIRPQSLGFLPWGVVGMFLICGSVSAIILLLHSAKSPVAKQSPGTFAGSTLGLPSKSLEWTGG